MQTITGQIECDRCGTLHFDDADRLPYEDAYCPQCTEILFNTDSDGSPF